MVVLSVAAEIERLHSHPVLFAQFLCEKATRSDRVEVHAISVFREHATPPHWVKPRLKILYEIESDTPTSIAVHAIRRAPGSCKDRMSVSHALCNIVHLARESRKDLPNSGGIIGGVTAVNVVEINATKMSRPLQAPRRAKAHCVATRTRRRRCGDPVDNEALVSSHAERQPRPWHG